MYFILYIGIVYMSTACFLFFNAKAYANENVSFKRFIRIYLHFQKTKNKNKIFVYTDALHCAFIGCVIATSYMISLVLVANKFVSFQRDSHSNKFNDTFRMSYLQINEIIANIATITLKQLNR